MLSFKKLFCFSWITYTVCGNIIRNQPSKYETTTAPTTQCPPDQSFNSRNDIKAMIDYFYNEKSLDKLIEQQYQTNAEAIRDKHLEDLNDFIVWFENQPGHLKDVLRRLERLREIHVEPSVDIVAGVLAEYPKFEEIYNDKIDKTNELENRFHRYNMICKLNCEDQEIEEHYVGKRSAQDEYYCSSLENLHKSITQNLDDFVKKLNDNTTEKLYSDDKKYEEKVDEIKSKLKEKALKEFGRTMYDILSLEDEYDHFMDDITSTDLFSSVYSIKSLGLQIDAKLLELEHAIEKFGQHCNSCHSKDRVRNVRQALFQSERNEEMDSLNIVTQLIEIKFNEIANMIENNYENIYHDLNILIEEIEAKEFTMEKLRPIQEEIDRMTNAEKETLRELKQQVPKISIKKLLDLIKKLTDILKRILDILDKLPGYTFQK